MQSRTTQLRRILYINNFLIKSIVKGAEGGQEKHMQVSPVCIP